MTLQFDTKMDRQVKIITLLVHVLVLPIPLFLLPLGGIAETIFMGIFYLILFGIAFLLRPYQYVLEDDLLIIRKHILPRKIKLADILSIEPVDFKDLKLTLRLWGSGGLWGWYGYFLTSKMGRVNLQCTGKNKLVLIKLAGKEKIIISPSDRTGFLETLRAKTGLQQVQNEFIAHHTH